MKNITTILFLSSILALSVACGDDEGGGDNPDAMVQPDAEPELDADLTAFPTLGAQLDRVGRSAVATALIESFLFTDGTSQANGKNAYSQDATESGWGTAYSAEIAKNLAILDGLDSQLNTDNCGNQFLFNAGYDALAGALAGDRLVIDSTQGTCDQYLAVEAGVANDCGGRSPLVDTIDTTYTALAAGALTGVNSGIDAGDEDGTHTDDTFPYLAAPL